MRQQSGSHLSRKPVPNSALADLLLWIAAFASQVAGRDLVTGLLRRATVSAETVRAALERPLAQIVDAVAEVLEETPPQLAADLAARGLTLVGGGALLPGFDRLLGRATGLSVSVDGEPLTTVARGAGEALEEIKRLAPTGRRFHDGRISRWKPRRRRG